MALGAVPAGKTFWPRQSMADGQCWSNQQEPERMNRSEQHKDYENKPDNSADDWGEE